MVLGFSKSLEELGFAMRCCESCIPGRPCCSPSGRLGASNPASNPGTEPSLFDQITKTLLPVVNTGVSIWSSQQQLKLSKDASKDARNQAQLQLEALRIQSETAQANALAALNSQSNSSGLSTGAIVGIGVGAVALLTGIVLLARR